MEFILRKQKTVKKAEETFELIGNLEKLYKRANNFEKAQILKFLGKDYIFEERDIKAQYKTPFSYFAYANSLRTKSTKIPKLDVLTATNNENYLVFMTIKQKVLIFLIGVADGT